MRYGVYAALLAGAMLLLPGRTALAAGYTFEAGKLPSSTRIKVYREFDTVNRQEGTVSYFTVALPLAIDASSQPVPDKQIKAKL